MSSHKQQKFASPNVDHKDITTSGSSGSAASALVLKSKALLQRPHHESKAVFRGSVNDVANHATAAMQVKAKNTSNIDSKHSTFAALCFEARRYFSTKCPEVVSDKVVITFLVRELLGFKVFFLGHSLHVLNKLSLRLENPDDKASVVIQKINKQFPHLASRSKQNILLDMPLLQTILANINLMFDNSDGKMARILNRVMGVELLPAIQLNQRYILNVTKFAELTVLRMFNIQSPCSSKTGYFTVNVEGKIFFDFYYDMSEQDAVKLIDAINKHGGKATKTKGDDRFKVIFNGTCQCIRINVEFLQSQQFLNSFQQTFEKLYYGLNTSDNNLIKRELKYIESLNVGIDSYLAKYLKNPPYKSDEFIQMIIELQTVLNNQYDSIDSRLKAIAAVCNKLYKFAADLCIPQLELNSTVVGDKQAQVNDRLKTGWAKYLVSVAAEEMAPVKKILTLLKNRYPLLSGYLVTKEYVQQLMNHQTVVKSAPANAAIPPGALGDYKAPPPRFGPALSGQAVKQPAVVIADSKHGVAAIGAVSSPATAITPNKYLS